MVQMIPILFFLTVAPFVGAWIEIAGSVKAQIDWLSLRSSERGLKWPEASHGKAGHRVAPFVGAWIEIC